jgi:uncharacterized iron-regulated membrane protein
VTLRTLHRRLGLWVGVLWLLQALTGSLVAFRYEIDDATIHTADVRLDPAGLGARIEALTRAGASVESVWSSGSGTDRFDVYFTGVGGRAETLRVDGAGSPLRHSSADDRTLTTAVLEALSTAHESLFAGDAGRWLIGVSGAVLLVNLLSGLWFARSHWRAWLRWPAGAPGARLLGWHRQIGLWLAVPAAIVALSGVGLAYRQELEERAGPAPGPPPAEASGAPGPARVTAAQALGLALDRYPGAGLTALILPSADGPWYRVRLLTAAERPRVWGTTTVWVDAADARVLAFSDARTKPAVQRLLDALYPVHTGESGGITARVVVVLTGLGLAVLFGAGTAAWYSRRLLGNRG